MLQAVSDHPLGPFTEAQLTELSSYHYIPTEWVCIIFVALYGITAGTSTTLPQTSTRWPDSAVAGWFFSAIYFKMWWLLPTATLAAIGEVVGWSGRLWSSINVLADTPFLMQYVFFHRTYSQPLTTSESKNLLYHHRTNALPRGDFHPLFRDDEADRSRVQSADA